MLLLSPSAGLLLETILIISVLAFQLQAKYSCPVKKKMEWRFDKKNKKKGERVWAEILRAN